MTPQQFKKVKEYQREYKKLYGKKLYIDWPYMKDVPKRPLLRRYSPNIPIVDPEKILKKCVRKYKADLQIIKDRSTRIHMHGHTKERLAMVEYCKTVLNNRCNATEAANLINRHRSVLYHYATM